MICNVPIQKRKVVAQVARRKFSRHVIAENAAYGYSYAADVQIALCT